MAYGQNAPSCDPLRTHNWQKTKQKNKQTNKQNQTKKKRKEKKKQIFKIDTGIWQTKYMSAAKYIGKNDMVHFLTNIVENNKFLKYINFRAIS